MSSLLGRQLVCGYNVEISVSVGYPAHISSSISVAICGESKLGGDVVMITPIHRLPRLRIGKQPLDIMVSCL